MLRCDFCAVAYTGYPSLSAHGLIYCIGLCYLGAYVIERDEYMLSLKSDGELRKVAARPLARVSSFLSALSRLVPVTGTALGPLERCAAYHQTFSSGQM